MKKKQLWELTDKELDIRVAAANRGRPLSPRPAPAATALTNVAGKFCAVASLGMTVVTYGHALDVAGGILDGAYPAIHDPYEETPEPARSRLHAQVQAENADRSGFGDLSLAAVLSLSAGFAGIALGNKRRDNEYYDRMTRSQDNDGEFIDGFAEGFNASTRGARGWSLPGWPSSSSSSSSDWSSDDGDGNELGVLGLVGLGITIGIVVGTAYVSAKSVRANFGP
jgi:hypothetical protein